MLAGALMALIHAFLTITIRVNQIVSGLAITIFAGIIGLSSYLGQIWNIGGIAGDHKFNSINLFGLKNLPILGPLVFHEDAFVYAVLGARLAPPSTTCTGPGPDCTCGLWGRTRLLRMPWGSTSPPTGTPTPSSAAPSPGLGGAYFTLALVAVLDRRPHRR